MTTEVLIGEELFIVSDHGVDATYGNWIELANPATRITSSTNKCYPHGIGAMVGINTTYKESNPETGSPLKLYGLSSTTTVVDTNSTYGQLDAYAASLLLGFGAFYKKAAGWLILSVTGVKRVGMSTVQPSLTTPPRVGDTVSIVEYSGATPVDYEIISVTIKYDEGRVFLELGDYEKNVFTSLMQETNAINKTLT